MKKQNKQKKNKPNNPRFRKKLYHLWITPEEELSLMEKLDKKIKLFADLEIIGLIIQSAKDRGDLND